MPRSSKGVWLPSKLTFALINRFCRRWCFWQARLCMEDVWNGFIPQTFSTGQLGSHEGCFLMWDHEEGFSLNPNCCWKHFCTEIMSRHIFSTSMSASTVDGGATSWVDCLSIPFKQELGNTLTEIHSVWQILHFAPLKLFDLFEDELQLVVVAPCDQALES